MNVISLDSFLVPVLLLNFVILAVGRLHVVIHAVAAQGAILAITYLLAHGDISEGGAAVVSLRLVVLASVMFVVRGLLMPRMLSYAMNKAGIHWRIESYLGLTASLLIGALGTALIAWSSHLLPLRPEDASHLLVPSSLATVFTGFLILMTRREALTQIIGYLVLENGIFIFGLLLVEAMPMMVELGILLDLFVGVFIMGIIVHHVSRQFPETTTDHLTSLRE